MPWHEAGESQALAQQFSQLPLSSPLPWPRLRRRRPGMCDWAGVAVAAGAMSGAWAEGEAQWSAPRWERRWGDLQRCDKWNSGWRVKDSVRQVKVFMFMFLNLASLILLSLCHLNPLIMVDWLCVCAVAVSIKKHAQINTNTFLVNRKLTKWLQNTTKSNLQSRPPESSCPSFKHLICPKPWIKHLMQSYMVK